MNADYWEKRTVLIRDAAVRMLSLSGSEEVDYWRNELKSNRRNSSEIELMTLAKKRSNSSRARTLRAHGRSR